MLSQTQHPLPVDRLGEIAEFDRTFVEFNRLEEFAFLLHGSSGCPGQANQSGLKLLTLGYLPTIVPLSPFRSRPRTGRRSVSLARKKP